MKIIDIAWLAGLLEGEGSFMIRGGSPRLVLQSTDLDVVQRAARLFGCKVPETADYKPKGKATYKPVYGARIFGMRALGWMMTLYSLLGQRRRAQVRTVIGEWQLSKARLHAPPGLRMPAICHPDRPTKGLNLCRECYMRHYRRTYMRAYRKRAA
jgi:hypothetical protein